MNPGALLILSFLLWTGLVRATELSTPAEDPDVVASAIAMLASDDFHKRESASRMLWGEGEAAIEGLAEAAKSADPEVAYRARILWDRIRTGIGPETPAEIVELVQKYNQDGVAGKRRVLEALKRVNAFPQVLRLYHFEEDEAVRTQCFEVVNSVVTAAVQQALLRGDNEEAISFLRIAPKTDENYRRLAALYRETGGLSEAIDTLREREDSGSKTLLLACYRAKGDVDAALELARSLDRRDVVAVLSILQGDPVPYLEWRIEGSGEEPVARLHLEIALEQWKGDDKRAARLVRPMIEMAKEGYEEGSLALHSLLLNGYFEDAAKVMRREQPQLMFSYYETMEQPWKALEELGYSKDDAANVKWRDEHLKAVRETWDFYSSECHAYLSVAGILYARGETEKGQQLVRFLMEGAREAGGEPWQEFLGALGERAGVFYEIGFRLLEEEIGPDTAELDVLNYVSSLLGESEGAQKLWNYLGKVTELGLGERFLALGKVYGVVPAPAGEVEELWAALMAHAAKERNPEGVYRTLLEPAFYRDDASAVLALLEKLVEKDGGDQWRVSLANFQAFLHEWEEAEKLWGSMMGEGGAGKRYLGSYAAVLLRVGEQEKALGLLAELDRGSLDEPVLLGNIAKVMESSGMWDVAADYWRRILLTSTPPDWHWNIAVGRLIREAKVDKNWALAASLALVESSDSFEERSVQSNPVPLLRKGFATVFYRGLLALEEGERERGERLLSEGFNLLRGDGVLADDFFPILREEGYVELHDQFFEQAYARIMESLKDFPRSHNTHNGAAWLASRAARRLDEAENHARIALKMRPRQAAYLDTMAEVWFARHNRDEAVGWSERALRDSQFGGHSTDSGAELRAQYDRFVSGKFPAR